MKKSGQEDSTSYEHRKMWSTLLPVAAGMAIALTPSATKDVESASAAAPAHESRSPVVNIQNTMRKINNPKVGERIRVLVGKTSNLIAKRGSNGYAIDGKSGDLKRIVLAEDTSILVGASVKKGDSQYAVANDGDRTFAVKLSPGTTREVITVSKGVLHVKRFDPRDVREDTMRIDVIGEDGAPYSANIAPELQIYASDEKFRIPGQRDRAFVVPIGLAATADAPPPIS